MTVIREILAWLSWYIVSTLLYAITWTQLDGGLSFAMPATVVLPLSDFLGATSADGVYDVYVWSTSIGAVVCLHVATWIVLRRLKSATLADERNGSPGQRLFFSVVGWTCWLLVSTSVLLVIGDEIAEARGMKLSSDVRQQSIDFVAGLVVVGLLHLAVLKIARRLRS